MSAFSSVVFTFTYICGGKQRFRVVSFQMLHKDFTTVNMCIAIVSYRHKCCGACLHYFRYKFGPMTSSQAWMAPHRGPRLHWSQRQQQLQAQQQQQPARQPRQLPPDRAATDDTIDVLGAFGNHPRQAEWRKLWELAGAAFFNRQHRVLWWRILHGCVMCGAFRAYIGRATPEQACCPFACCSAPTQSQTISHMFLDCPVAATVVSWLCRLWQAVTGYMPEASVATILAASVSEGQCTSDALLQTWHRLRLAVLHSIWTASYMRTLVTASWVAADGMTLENL